MSSQVPTSEDDHDAGATRHRVRDRADSARRALPRLALVDWGVGGVGVLRELRAKNPDCRVTYFSDSGAPPYGLLSPRVLSRRLHDVVAWLASRGVAEVFFACNAASSVLTNDATAWPLPVSGIIDAGVTTVRASGARVVGIVGGMRTVRSGVYRRALRADTRVIVQRVAQPLSAAIEAGAAHAASTAALVGRITAPLAHVDALLLACTHYPASLHAFEAALPGVLLLDPAGEAATRLADRSGDVATRDAFFTTGDARQMQRAAQAAFGVEIRDVERVDLGPVR